MTTFRPVVVESPFAGNRQLNDAYLRAALRDCLLRGKAPFASHGLYTQEGVLNDEVPEERALGISAGFAFRPISAGTVFYIDLGISSGMAQALEHCLDIGQTFELRSLPGWDKATPSAPPSFTPSRLVRRISFRTFDKGAEVSIYSKDRGNLLSRSYLPVAPLATKQDRLRHLLESASNSDRNEMTHWTIVFVSRPDLEGYRMGLFTVPPDQISIE